MKKKKRTSFFKDFVDFINKGNIVDMAIGIIVGNAFTKIVNSLVNDVIMPVFSNIIKIDITTAKAVLREEIVNETGEITQTGIYLSYGVFIQNIINFLIIALAIFFAIKVVTSIKNTYTRYQIKYVKMLKKKHPEYFDEEDEFGTLLYEKLKKEHPEAFENEKKVAPEEPKKDPIVINNELLEKLNKNIELMTDKMNNN